jgi:hypothetical protein
VPVDDTQILTVSPTRPSSHRIVAGCFPSGNIGSVDHLEPRPLSEPERCCPAAGVRGKPYLDAAEAVCSDDDPVHG